ncbi:hypothetical protein AUR64_02540 [Haloprofundus marisrubri]|uniref:Uncharacterized protein n=1 Tax=Haloprofundus marisrubri TaxID=1514971 RepID=A0A0W1R3H7_9EURY|nr:hypothetical protein [Haloprofundus marisrubri]KTG07738.1 hypothetical protein AUR64_02540 [Haloprofundus marisrubri]
MAIDEPVDRSGESTQSERSLLTAEDNELSEMPGVLSQQTDRRILIHPLSHDGPIPVESLAAQFAAPGASEPPEPPDGPTDRKQEGP